MNKLLLVIVLIQAILLGLCCGVDIVNKFENQNTYIPEIIINPEEISQNVIIDDWNLRLVNYENYLPEDFEVELESIDSTRKFDKRAITELFAMQKALKDNGITNLWVQSAYRSIEHQKELFDKKINQYMALRKNRSRCRKINSANNK